MSTVRGLNEVNRFIDDLKSEQDNYAFRLDAEKNQAENLTLAPMVRVVFFANTKGYQFTIEDARGFAQVRMLQRNKELEPTEAILNWGVGVYFLTDGMLYGLGRLDHLDEMGLPP
jgi:hypothetical protein